MSLANAWQVLRKVWTERENARSYDKLAALGRIDTGVERERDIGVTLDARGTGDWSARVVRTYGPSVIVVPRQRQFPKSFLGVIQTSTTYATKENDHAPQNLGAVALLVLTKTSPTARWRVATESGGTGLFSDLPHFRQAFKASSDPHPGYSPTAREPSWITPTAAVTDLADYYQHYVDDGTPPPSSIFAAGNWTTGQGTRASTDTTTGKRELNGQITTKGFRQTVRYFLDRTDPVYHFNFGGASLVCGTVRGISRATPGDPGGYLYQNPGRTNWGGWLAPGDYASITTYLFHQVCMHIPSTATQKIQVLSGDDSVSDWTVTGHHSNLLKSLLHAIAWTPPPQPTRSERQIRDAGATAYAAGALAPYSARRRLPFRRQARVRSGTESGRKSGRRSVYLGRFSPAAAPAGNAGGTHTVLPTSARASPRPRHSHSGDRDR